MNKGPHAYRTRLGWCISSLFSESKSLKVNTIKIDLDNQVRWPAMDAAGGPSSISFGIESRIRDYEVVESLKEVWNADTFEPNSEMISLSIEDRRFLEIMKNNIRLVEGHYELPMPFREDNPIRR